MGEKSKEKKKITLTLDEDIVNHLKRIAELNHTSMTQWITDQVVTYVRSAEYKEISELFG